ncbi:calcium-binding protein [Paracoccus lutimaris]|uniref:Hemolysin type calcium-binding protein n=1 Tax=Paracoccus lutimaris TaxID=1490030 RepID=A0A368YZV1_9RHOB|nr:calcium-binding protein [Paracoccus lutimaris]RCW85078.1 hemolysin type calcium-binding protein [Paracoccus lutimaris]
MALFSGTAGANNLQGTTSRDTLAGYSGDDWIDGHRGADVAVGGPGADTFIWDEDRNAGRPTLDIYSGSDWGDNYDSNIYGDLSGGDKLILGAASGAGGFRVFFTDTESGAAIDAYGNKVSFSGIERLESGSGDDYINGSGATVLPGRHAGTAHHVPTHGLTALGGGGNDTVIGTRTVDVLDGGEGDDHVYGGAGNDLLMSSAGSDYGHAGAGDDNVRWGNNGGTAPIYDIGHDTLIGGDGSDLINLWGKGDGDNSIGTVVNFYTASSGYATFARDNGSVVFSEFEQFWTHEGKDTVSAANADVAVNGGGINFNTRWGDDLLTGSNGRDTLEGGNHADTINGGQGDDIISMFEEAYHADGSGVLPDDYRDVLVLEDNFGTDRVRAFQVGNDSGRPADRLNVANLHDQYGNSVDVNDVVVSSQGSNAMLIFPNGERLILEGVSPSSLTEATLIGMGIPASGAQSTGQAVRAADSSESTSSTATAVAASDASAAVSADADAATDSGRVLLGIYSSETFAANAAADDASFAGSFMDVFLG